AAMAGQHLLAHPEDKLRVLEMIRTGMQMWERLPVLDMLARREALFQEGLRQHADVVGDYEIWPGRRLIDTTPEERQETAHQWSTDMKASRLRYMGLAEALDEVPAGDPAGSAVGDPVGGPVGSAVGGTEEGREGAREQTREEALR